MRAIPLHGRYAAGRVVLVDDDDFELVSQYRWFPYNRSPHDRTTYASCNYTRNGKTTTKLMHSLLTGWPRTDHRNHNGLDNRRANLRPATVSQNNANMQAHRDGSSRFKGVSWDKKRELWKASIQYQYKRMEIGRFKNEEDAARAYDAAARRLVGTHAGLNFPDAPPLREAELRQLAKRTPEPAGDEIRRCDCGYWMTWIEGADGGQWLHLLPSTDVCPQVQGSLKLQRTWRARPKAG